ncbi:MAG: stage II sporulation protein M [Nanoarchaeota archaeon]|nr:stage II sporulation protein M [Nanoarchaeota archaeon]
MFEKILLDAEKKDYLFRILFVTLAITVILAFFNSFIGANSLFLVALISLALAYPVITYIREMDIEELEKSMETKLLILRHEKEMAVFWAIFVGLVIGFYIATPLISDFTYQEAFKNKISGNLTQTNLFFTQILLNNLEVNLMTFIISFLAFSGLIFVLVWNASIVSYHLYSLSSHKLALLQGIIFLSHGLIEIGGYILAGIAGSILALKIDRKTKFNHSLNKEFFKDLSILIFTSILLIFIGAGIESL